MPAIVSIETDAIAPDTTPRYTGVLKDDLGNPVPGSALNTLTLTIADPMTGAIVNGCELVNILNVGRGTVDSFGNLTVALTVEDTDVSGSAGLPTVPTVPRALIFDYTYNDGAAVGRHEAIFPITILAGP
jgi:hypothetical protein